MRLYKQSPPAWARGDRIFSVDHALRLEVWTAVATTGETPKGALPPLREAATLRERLRRTRLRLDKQSLPAWARGRSHLIYNKSKNRSTPIRACFRIRAKVERLIGR
ncbi:hypothetical protein ACF3DV_15865 [Chlorogloeopsis fritschii PCC 9212]|uniref:hypothetical protein n=1 Tax=Chlorogloeopsis fritschii TaxID=1124 RepID=UPI00138AD7B8|nr:hypothetical protein [Chlorogloeopsis fritschii]